MNLELWKQVKKNKKLTLKDISDISNIPKRTVDDIFSGKTTKPRIDTVKAIERALGLKNDQIDVSPKTKEIVDLLMQLDDDKLEDALSVIKIIAKK